MKTDQNNHFFKYGILLILGSFLCLNCQPKEKKTTSEVAESKTEMKKNTISAVEQQMKMQGLINIQMLDSTILVELKYSTIDNFVKTDVYGELTRAYLQLKPAEMLVKASKNLQEKYPNYRLLVYDAARPLSVQHILWNLLDTIPPRKRKDFVADPKDISIHNFGSAVDLTVYDTVAKQPLDMGTPYDFFGDLAFPRLEAKMLREKKLTQQQVDNRLVLRNAMLNAGYSRIESEWWHFNAMSRKQAKNTYEVIK